MLFQYPDKLDLAQVPTPFHSLDRLSEHLGGPRIWIKRDDLTGCATSGNKVRKLEFLLAEAVAAGCDTIITCGGVQSNHCRATAILGAQLGLSVHLLLRADRDTEAVGNLLLDQLVGARITHYSRNDFRQLTTLMRRWEEDYLLQDRKPFCIPTGGSNATGIWGYIGTAGELSADFKRANIQPQAIVHATGSGGTQAGLTLGTRLHDLRVPVIGFAVCDDEAYFNDKIAADIGEWNSKYGIGVDPGSLSIQTNANHIGPGYSIATPEIFDTIRLVAQSEGIILDPVYSGKAFHGMLQEIKSGAFTGSDLVFIHTGGIFGLLAQSHELNLKKQ